MTRRGTATAAGPAVMSQTTVETIPQAFSRTARQYAVREALGDGTTTLTYAELDDVTDRIARALRARGLRPGERVGVRLDRSPALYEVFLGVLKAGCVVVPFNPGHPADYTARMHRLAAPALTVTDPGATAEEIPAATRLPVDALLSDAAALPATPLPTTPLPTTPPDAEVGPESPAFILFTSGSTGEPKGVVLAHRGIARVSRYLTGFTPGPQDRFLQLAQPSFAASTTDIWACLLRGGRLSLAPQELPRLGELAALIARERTTVLNLPVGLFNLLVEHHPRTLAQIRSVIVSGDFPSATHLGRALDDIGGDLFNAFGCTENSALTAVHRITRADLSGTTVPVGRPMPGVETTVRDEHLEECAPGEIGELCIAGDGVALGYLDDPDLTDRKFVPYQGRRLLRTGDLARRTEDGEIVLAGRTDQMLKVRGFRVEPRQIEVTAESHPGVERAVAQAAPSEGAADRLALWCARAPGQELTEHELLDHLRRQLPDHLVPSTVLLLDVFPLNANGKIDRGELATRLTARRATPTPGSDTGDRLAETVRTTLAEVTGQDPIGPDDGLIENGVTSLHLIDLGARLEDVTGVALAPDEIFDAGTARGVADLIRTKRARG